MSRVLDGDLEYDLEIGGAGSFAAVEIAGERYGYAQVRAGNVTWSAYRSLTPAGDCRQTRSGFRTVESAARWILEGLRPDAPARVEIPLALYNAVAELVDMHDDGSGESECDCAVCSAWETVR